MLSLKSLERRKMRVTLTPGGGGTKARNLLAILYQGIGNDHTGKIRGAPASAIDDCHV